jgi:hypothetical protein
MRFIAERLGVVGRWSLLLAPLLLGGCFYSPSTGTASLPPNATPTVLLSQQQYDQPNNAAPSPEEKTRAAPEKRMKSSAARAKDALQEPDSADAWAAENQASIVDDAALKKKLVICDGCTFKPTPQQRRETVEQTGSPAGWDVNSR